MQVVPNMKLFFVYCIVAYRWFLAADYVVQFVTNFYQKQDTSNQKQVYFVKNSN